MELGGENRAHKSKTTGVKAKKKEDKKKKKKGAPEQPAKTKHNQKAFSVANIGRTQRKQQRNLDRAQKKELVPLVDRTEELAPPSLVVVMGPKGCGKTTLIRSLVKIYTGQNLSSTSGPITVVAGPKRRLTFFECPLDIHSMTDLSKVADLVILMIDGSYGFEMETFEFLNLLQLHGFPKVVGVLTHLDHLKVSKSLQKTKKDLKHRFWTEIYKGAKMFDFTGIINGKYIKHEVKRLSLYISRIKFRPLVWRNTHPYLVSDRIEDITPRSKVIADSTCDRDLTFYGYVRGSHLRSNLRMHLMGAGDFDMYSATVIPDPCATQKEHSLRKKDNLLYAPQADIGRVKMDEDGIYIDLKHVNYTKSEDGSAGSGDLDDNTPINLVRRMQDVMSGVNEKIDDAEMSLFKGGQGVRSSTFVESTNDGYDDESSGDEDDAEDSGSDDDDAEGSGSEDEFDEDDDVGPGDDQDGAEETGVEEVQRIREGSSSGSDSESDSDDEDEDEDDEEEEDGEEEAEAEEGGARWKDDMAKRAAAAYLVRKSEAGEDLMSKVYGSLWAMPFGHENAKKSSEKSKKDGAGSDSDSDSDDGDDIFEVKSVANRPKDYNTKNSIDSSRAKLSSPSLSKWGELITSLDNKDDINEKLLSMNTIFRNRFVTGNWKKANLVGSTGDDQNSDGGDDSGSEFGELIDLEDPEQAPSMSKSKKSSRHDRDSDDSDSDDSGSGSGSDSEGSEDEVDEDEMNDEIDRSLRDHHADLKAKSRNTKEAAASSAETDAALKGEEEYDEAAYLEALKKKKEDQKERNRREFGQEGEAARLQHEGFRQGLYIRVVLRNVPCEFLSGFQSHIPIVLGGLLPHEEALGFVTARVKRHRWHKKILKSNDPLIFSIGWRRFQTMPVYTVEDDNDRRRFLKYTPEHMHCYASFYGPLVQPNTGVLAFQRTNNTNVGFRLSLTGTALDLEATSTIVKKLRLVGHPTKVFKNTAFVTGMFNSEMEVAKFQGAKLKTASGIRGQIKKAIADGEPGKFRATFEDKVLMSDMISCRLWVPVNPIQYYNPVTSLLKSADGSSWEGMRPIAQIRKDKSIPIPVNKDSLYKPVERKKREFRKLLIPDKLQDSLPFAVKPKQTAAKKGSNYVERRAVILDPEDKKKRAAIQMLNTIKVDKSTKRTDKKKEKTVERNKKKARESAVFADDHAENKKRKFVEKGLRERAAEQKKQRH